MGTVDEKEGGAAEPFKIVKEGVAVMLNDIAECEVSDEMLTDNVSISDQVWIRKFGVFISAWEQIDGMDAAFWELMSYPRGGSAVISADLEDGLRLFSQGYGEQDFSIVIR